MAEKNQSPNKPQKENGCNRRQDQCKSQVLFLLYGWCHSATLITQLRLANDSRGGDIQLRGRFKRMKWCG